MRNHFSIVFGTALMLRITTGVRTWNDLYRRRSTMSPLHHLCTLLIFRNRLKLHLCRLSYPGLVLLLCVVFVIAACYLDWLIDLIYWYIYNIDACALKWQWPKVDCVCCSQTRSWLRLNLLAYHQQQQQQFMSTYLHQLSTPSFVDHQRFDDNRRRILRTPPHVFMLPSITTRPH